MRDEARDDGDERHEGSGGHQLRPAGLGSASRM
jgi:hypothetical protein